MSKTTTIYVARHSEPFRKFLGEYNSKESEQIRNEKNPLSVNGEIKAKKLSEFNELRNVEILYSSHYVRAMSTAKYIAEANNINLNVDERFGERKIGVNDYHDIPKNYWNNQFSNWDYKLNDGESLNETKKRMTEAFNDVLKNCSGKTIMIVSHGSALSTLFQNWCNVILNRDLVEIWYHETMVFDGNWDTPELFKLVFNEKNELISIANLKI